MWCYRNVSRAPGMTSRVSFKDECKLVRQGRWRGLEALGTACVRGKVTQDEADRRSQSSFIYLFVFQGLPYRTYKEYWLYPTAVGRLFRGLSKKVIWSNCVFLKGHLSCLGSYIDCSGQEQMGQSQLRGSCQHPGRNWWLAVCRVLSNVLSYFIPVIVLPWGVNTSFSPMACPWWAGAGGSEN